MYSENYPLGERLKRSLKDDSAEKLTPFAILKARFANGTKDIKGRHEMNDGIGNTGDVYCIVFP